MRKRLAVRRRWTSLCAWLLPALVAAPALAYPGMSMRLDHPNPAVPGNYFFEIGEKAFKQGQLSYARDMFRVAASWAQKTAQYNLGLMYFKGVGVPVDHAEGMAWLALAAERGDKPFVDAREWAYAKMTEEEFARANVRWRELKVEYGDATALVRAKARYVRIQRQATGSHLGSVAFTSGVAEDEDGNDFYEKLRRARGPYDVAPYPHVEVGDLTPLEGAPPKQ